MQLLLASQINGEEMAEDDPQMSYMISAWARICKILGAGFAPYLPMVMGPVMKTASLKPEVSQDMTIDQSIDCHNTRLLFLTMRSWEVLRTSLMIGSLFSSENNKTSASRLLDSRTRPPRARCWSATPGS